MLNVEMSPQWLPNGYVNLHLTDLHYNDSEGNTPDRLRYLASVLKDIYTCKLKRDFPEKVFRVEVCGEPDEPILTFYQVA